MERISWVQASRIQATRRPESKCPESNHLVVHIPSVQPSRVQTSRPCVQSSAFPICWTKLTLSKLEKVAFTAFTSFRTSI